MVISVNITKNKHYERLGIMGGFLIPSYFALNFRFLQKITKTLKSYFLS